MTARDDYDAACTALYGAADELLTQWDRGDITSIQFARRLLPRVIACRKADAALKAARAQSERDS